MTGQGTMERPNTETLLGNKRTVNSEEGEGEEGEEEEKQRSKRDERTQKECRHTQTEKQQIKIIKTVEKGSTSNVGTEKS